MVPTIENGGGGLQMKDQTWQDVAEEKVQGILIF